MHINYIYLSEESIITLHQQRLKMQIKDLPITEDVNIEWETLTRCIENAALEVLGTRRRRRGK